MLQDVARHETRGKVVGDGSGATEMQRRIHGPLLGPRRKRRGGRAQPLLVVLHREQPLIEHVARRGRFDAAARLGEERAAVVRLELADMLRHRGLCDQERGGGAREAPLPIDLQERMGPIIQHGCLITNRNVMIIKTIHLIIKRGHRMKTLRINGISCRLGRRLAAKRARCAAIGTDR